MDQDKDICLFCGEKVDDDDKIECSNCKSIYHKNCFEKLKGICMKCDSDNLKNEYFKKEDSNDNITEVKNTDDNTQGENKKTYCTKCGEVLNEGQIFCGKCGTKINNTEDNIKEEKKDKLKEQSTSKKNRKYIIGLIAAALIIIIAVIIINNITKQQQEQEQAEARNEYLQNVVLYEGTLIIAGSNLEDIADTTQTYWHENIFENKHGADINEAILNAFDDKSSEIAAAKEYNDDIKNLYTELKDIPEGSEDLSDLLNIISDTYNSYTDFYDLAIYPEGNYNQYSENNNQRTNDFLDSYRELENYIETDKEFTNLEKTYK